LSSFKGQEIVKGRFLVFKSSFSCACVSSKVWFSQFFTVSSKVWFSQSTQAGGQATKLWR